MKIALIVINDEGYETAKRITEEIPEATILRNTRPGGLPDLVAETVPAFGGLVFIMATGIAVRMIAPHIRDKYSDPAVVVLDDACRFAISLLSGHEGGANDLAYRIAAAVGADPVITTGTETNKRITVGIGCRKGAAAEDIAEAVRLALRAANLSPGDVRLAASIDIKKHETGLIEACRNLGIPLKFFRKERINSLRGGFEENETAMRNIGARGVSEPCALLGGRNSSLVVPKTVYKQVTVAVAAEEEHHE